MLNGMTYAEYIDWQAFYSVEPFPEERQDIRTAYTIFYIQALLLGKKAQKNIQPFIPNYWGDTVADVTSMKHTGRFLQERFRSMGLDSEWEEA